MNPLRIGIVAGEHSGDILGAGLIQELRKLHSNLVIEGIGGPKMMEEGCQSFFAMENLSVMGVWEVAQRLPKILNIRRQLINYFQKKPPDLFIGIDAPDFNLTIEERLRRSKIPTLHYVSPSVWAWKQWRIKKIKRAVDEMLTLLPFESTFYAKHNVSAQFIGHPLADAIPRVTDPRKARELLNLPPDKKIIALLPGSRSNEIKYLGKLFLQTANWCYQKNNNLFFVAPMINAQIKQQFSEMINSVAPNLPLSLIDQQAQTTMIAADAVLLASGTASLEAMLVKKPMVVAYRMSNISFAIAKRMIKTAYISLPNLLANKCLVPELIQHEATIESLGTHLMKYFDDNFLVNNLVSEFDKLHALMQRNASKEAAKAAMNLMQKTHLS